MYLFIRWNLKNRYIAVQPWATDVRSDITETLKRPPNTESFKAICKDSPKSYQIRQSKINLRWVAGPIGQTNRRLLFFLDFL